MAQEGRPGFTVIVPVYNRAATLAPALESVLAQTRPADEILVIDDGSSDDLAAALAPYGESVRLIRQQNAGVAAARNLGAREARFGWLAFQDSDDLWSPDHLEVAARDLRGADPDVVAHLGEVAYVGEGYRQRLLADIKSRTFPEERAERIEAPLPLVVSGMTLQGAAIRRDVFLDLGGFDEEMRMLSDTAFFCQLALRGPFLVTGREVAQILRMEGDENAITAMHRTRRLYARQMAVRVVERIPQARLSAADRRLVRGILSGARLRVAEVEAETDRALARRTLLVSAREHHSPLTGWAKAAIAWGLGRRGHDFIQRRRKVLDRS